MAYDLQGMPTTSLRVSPVCPYSVSHVKPMGPPHPFNFNCNINIPILQSTFDLWNCTETFLKQSWRPFVHLFSSSQASTYQSVEISLKVKSPNVTGSSDGSLDVGKTTTQDLHQTSRSLVVLESWRIDIKTSQKFKSVIQRYLHCI